MGGAVGAVGASTGGRAFGLSLPYNTLSKTGVSIEDTSISSTVIIIKSGDSAYPPSVSVSITAEVTISATSPRAIMPTPPIALSRQLYLNALQIAPQPIILPISPNSTASSANSRMRGSSFANEMLEIPIFAKNAGAKTV